MEVKTLSQSEVIDLETSKTDIEQAYGLEALQHFIQYMDVATTENQEIKFNELIYIGTLLAKRI